MYPVGQRSSSRVVAVSHQSEKRSSTAYGIRPPTSCFVLALIGKSAEFTKVILE